MRCRWHYASVHEARAKDAKTIAAAAGAICAFAARSASAIRTLSAQDAFSDAFAAIYATPLQLSLPGVTDTISMPRRRRLPLAAAIDATAVTPPRCR